MESDGKTGSRKGSRERLPQTTKQRASAVRKNKRFLTNTRRKVIARRSKREIREKNVPHRKAEARPAIAEKRGMTRGRDSMAPSYHQELLKHKNFFTVPAKTVFGTPASTCGMQVKHEEPQNEESEE
jgi:hypothetical protein